MKGLILEYLKINKHAGSEIVFHLITHEQIEFSLSQQQIAQKINDLALFNIKWYPVKYLSGSFIIFKKSLNFIQTFFIALKIKWKYKPVAILGFLSIAGGFSYVISRLLRIKLIVYCFEPHSEYMIDFNIWQRSGLNYKLLKKFEALQIKKSDYLVVPNVHTKVFVEKQRSLSNIFVCPISINTDTMTFDPEARIRIRKKLNAENKTIIIYTGKFGGIYYSSDEVIKFYSGLYSQNNLFFFYIISPNRAEVEKSIIKYKLPAQSIHVSLTVSYNELNQHVSAADIGFVALPPFPSQIYRTPVKTAIYLSCGLPYIVNRNIGEDDLVAQNDTVGIVIENLNEDPALIKTKIEIFLQNDPSQLRNRCRNVAESTRSISAANAVLAEIFSEL